MREHMSQNTDRQPERAWKADSRDYLATPEQGRTNNGRTDNNKWYWPAREKKTPNHTRPQVRWRARRRKEQYDRASIGRGSCGNKLVQFLLRHAGKLHLFMHFKDRGTVFHDHFGEPRHPVCDAHSSILSIDSGCRRDTLRLLKVGGDDLVSCLPMRGGPKVSPSGAHPTVWLDEQIFRGLQKNFQSRIRCLVLYKLPRILQRNRRRALSLPFLHLT